MHPTNPEPRGPLAPPELGHPSTRDWRSRFRRALLAASGSLLAAAALSAPALAGPAHQARDHAATPVTYTYTTLDNGLDPTFNQLLGINNKGTIVGYFGNGSREHPNKGYVLDPPYGQGNYANENFPGSVQTQVTAINRRGVTVGFSVDPAGNNFGFVDRAGVFTDVIDPNGQHKAANGATIEQLLGVNRQGVAVGFWIDADGNSHGFLYDMNNQSVTEIGIPGFASVTPTAINDNGKVVGFYVGADGNDAGFIRSPAGVISTLTGPAGAVSTMALGVNNKNEVVGSWVDATGATHGFTWTRRSGYTTVNDPNAQAGPNAMTVVNGVNDLGQIVGFYLDNAGNTDGMLAMPTH